MALNGGGSEAKIRLHQLDRTSIRFVFAEAQVVTEHLLRPEHHRVIAALKAQLQLAPTFPPFFLDIPMDPKRPRLETALPPPRAAGAADPSRGNRAG